MIIWICNMREGGKRDEITLGVFSSKEKAEEQIKVFLDGQGLPFEEYQRNPDPEGEYVHFRCPIGYEHFTAHLTPYILDDFSY